MGFLRKIWKKIQIFLNNHNTEHLFIYISTTSVLDNYSKKDKYIRNKIIIENLIKKRLKNFFILRLPQIVGKSNNPHTITNFIYNIHMFFFMFWVVAKITVLAFAALTNVF